jgi:hypothetical protein
MTPERPVVLVVAALLTAAEVPELLVKAMLVVLELAKVVYPEAAAAAPVR